MYQHIKKKLLINIYTLALGSLPNPICPLRNSLLQPPGKPNKLTVLDP